MKNLLLLSLLTLFSCSTIQKAKDSRAVGRVLSNPDLTDYVYKIAIGLHPTQVQTIYIKGRDSVVIDSIAYPVFIDSIIKQKYPALNTDSIANTLRKTITILRVDTLKLPDTSLNRQLDFSLHTLYLEQGKSQQKDIQIASLEKTVTKKNWILVALGIIILGLGFLLFKP